MKRYIPILAIAALLAGVGAHYLTRVAPPAAPAPAAGPIEPPVAATPAA